MSNKKTKLLSGNKRIDYKRLFFIFFVCFLVLFAFVIVLATGLLDNALGATLK